MTNQKLLSTPKELLGELDKQRCYCLRIAMHPMPCPVCHAPVNQIDAAALMLDDFDAGKCGHDFCCSHCGTELVDIVPFMGPSYYWSVKYPEKVAEAVKVATKKP